MAFSYEGDYPTYHSQYDSFDWTTRFADEPHERGCPDGFCRHAAMATFVGAITMRLSNDRILPLNYRRYAEVMMGYASHLESKSFREGGVADAPIMPCPCANLDGAVASTCAASAPRPPSGCPREQISMAPIQSALRAMLTVTEAVEAERLRLSSDSFSELDSLDLSQARDLNDRLVLAERALTTREGLRDRTWFKHLVYAPGFFNNYGVDKFPMITDALCHTLIEEECVADWRGVIVPICL